MQEALTQILPLVGLFAIFYFLIIRPQQTQAKAHKAMIESLVKGDKILTNGGLYATVNKVNEEYFEVQIGDNTTARLDKQFVAKKLEV